MAQGANNRKFMVLLMGVTGAGKTTFASLASGQDLVIGHGLDPCTQDPLAVEFSVDEHRVVLIDTPGFDDDARNDVEILSDIAKWLSAEGLLRGQTLDGLVLLHPVTRNFVSGMERRRTQLLEKILGEDAYQRVTIATTMWGTLGREYAQRLDAEYKGVFDKNGRLGNSGVWANFTKKGAQVVRHDNNRESARSIIRTIVNRAIEEGIQETLLQKEIADRNVGFMGSALGQHLVAHLEEDIRLLERDLMKHREECPGMGARWSLHSASYRRWKEWEAERVTLEKRIARREAQLARLRGFVSWTGQLEKLWTTPAQVFSRLWT
ncbi:P-loop containing nucleoside triphosphate hydrolase protein [Immersiella caudata]|uniref:P-loop containing nucleoside triphosphate hydrolase protein n=1 Tax=Immersiella caudata TaxID=314043 RepID=A0AA39WCV7_9PEZI|nr:P-loop containing nucleoside triphosphate hydrolase protein [Immersiella caudata]